MNQKIILLLLVFLLPPLAGAVGFSPSSLTYLFGPHEELCQTIRLESDSETITVFDVWAPNVETEWRISEFTSITADHHLVLNYPNVLTIDEREVEICVIGEKAGEFHGAIVFRQAQEGSSIVQIAVWLKVIIEEQPQENNNHPANENGGGGGGIRKPIITTTSIKETDKEIQQEEESQFEQLVNEEETVEEELPVNVTSDAITDIPPGMRIGVKNFVPIAFIFFIAAAKIFVGRKRRQQAL